MSEYQYYQFQAIDRPLTAKQMQELRDISTRADITATSFVNSYQWGDLKADPLKLTQRYFDAHVYVANWGTHRFMLKFPRELIDVDLAAPYDNDETLSLHRYKDQVIVTFDAGEAEPPDWEDWDSGERWMGSLLPLRDDLMRGDLRSLYLGWLAGAWNEEAEEPPVPPGLRELSGPLQALADFLYLDPALIEAAARNDSAAPPASPSTEDLAVWLARVPESEKNELLLQLLENDQPGPVLSGMRRRFQHEWNQLHPVVAATAAPRRTVAELLEARETIAEEMRRIEAERKAKDKSQRDKKAAAKRKQYLSGLTSKTDDLWREVDALLETKVSKNYDQAVTLLTDLRDLAAMSGTDAQWQKRVNVYGQQYTRKSSLMRRFKEAGFFRSAKVAGM